MSLKPILFNRNNNQRGDFNRVTSPFKEGMEVKTSSNNIDKPQSITMLLVKHILLVMIIVLLATAVNAQDLTNLQSAKPFAMTSTLSANQVVYTMSGTDSRRNPYSYYLSGTSNISIYGILSIPLSFTYSNQQSQYGQPFNFNQFGATPSYKWIKAYVGYTSMTYSSYTLSGHQFLGGGIELTPPGGFRFSAMCGRLQKAVEPDSLQEQVVPSYRRIGFGTKMGFDNKGNSVDVILFKAKDDQQSLHIVSTDPAFAPMENLVLGLSTKINITKKLNVSAEIAGSALTRDVRTDNMNAPSGNIFKYTTFLQNNKSSTAYYKAWKAGVSYKGKTYSVGLGYERIDPEYQTLGAYYFTNDLENITVNATKSILEGKMNVSMNVGSQRNNLDNSKSSNMSQLVSSVTINYSASKKLNLGGSYSNFSSFTNVKSQFDKINNNSPYSNLDTLNFTQISQSLNFNCNYQIGNLSDKNKRQSFGANLSTQKASNKQNNKLLNSGTSFYNGNFVYCYSILPIDITLTSSINASSTKSEAMRTLTIGPTVGVTKLFLKKKLSSTFSTSVNNSYAEGTDIGNVISCRLSANYVLLKSHNFNFSLTVMNRSYKQLVTTNYTEITGMLGYCISF